jgi:threonine dehydrogenase-like Zn-dependent dehydrogenase
MSASKEMPMKAVCWKSRGKMAVDNVPDPKILNPHDAILKVTTTAICGSDLHLYNGFIPTMEAGDIVGHEFMGEVVEVGLQVRNLKKGDRVVVPFTIACGQCFFCRRSLWSLCDNSNPNAWMVEKLYGYSPAALFGYSHLFGGYAGGQAEYVRVPFADVGPLLIPEDMTDEQVLFLSDILPTGYQAAENGDIHAGDTVAVWGCGPVGLFAIQSAFLLGAERVIAIDHIGYRLEKARTACKCEVIDFGQEDVLERLNEMTSGRGPDVCIDCVGLEAHGHSIGSLYDKVKTNLFLETDRANVLRQAILACRKGGTVSVPGVYAGLLDSVPFGAAFGKGLTFRMGQTHVHRYLRPLLERIRKGEIDPRFVISHRAALKDAPAAYEMFNNKQDHCVKVVLTPH